MLVVEPGPVTRLATPRMCKANSAGSVTAECSGEMRAVVLNDQGVTITQINASQAAIAKHHAPTSARSGKRHRRGSARRIAVSKTGSVALDKGRSNTSRSGVNARRKSVREGLVLTRRD